MRKISKISIITLTVFVMILMIFVAGFACPPPEYQLNLSHIECVEEPVGGNYVEVHFVLLNVPDGITPGTLTYDYGSIAPGAHTGNVWHYTDYLPDGYYDIQNASVLVDGVSVYLHNPGDYAGQYDCSPRQNSASLSVGSDCEGWNVSVTASEGASYSAPSGTWNQPYIIESAPAGSVVVTWTSGSPLTLTLDYPVIFEPPDCQIPHEGEPFIHNDCEGWTVGYVLNGGDPVVVQSGTWDDPNKLEVATYDPFTIPVPDDELPEGGIQVEGGTISEPADCYVCEETPLYRMITAIDFDAPDWYWGTGARNGTCWIIMHEDGTYPSLDRQMEICSVCVHPDFIYEADFFLYDAYVVRDCNGEISYPDPLWRPEWFRSDYDNICHQPSCLDLEE